MENKVNYTEFLYNRYINHNRFGYFFDNQQVVVLTNNQELFDIVKYNTNLLITKESHTSFENLSNALYMELDSVKLLVLAKEPSQLLTYIDTSYNFFKDLKQKGQNKYFPTRIALSLNNKNYPIEKSVPNEKADELNKRINQTKEKINQFINHDIQEEKEV